MLTTVKPTTNQNQIEQQLLQIANRKDVLAVQKNTGRPNTKILKNGDLSIYIARHLNGIERIGFYTISKQDTTRFCVLDIDTHEGHQRTGIEINEAIEVLLTIVKFLEDNNIKCNIELSKSGGFHVWVVFNEPIPAEVVRKVLKYALSECNLEKYNLEIFPKQNFLNGKKVGNFVYLPFYWYKDKRTRTKLIDTDLNVLENQMFKITHSREFVAIIDDLNETELEALDLSEQGGNEVKFDGAQNGIELESLQGLQGLQILLEKCTVCRLFNDSRFQNSLSEKAWSGIIQNLKYFNGGINYIHRASELYRKKINRRFDYSKNETKRKIEAVDEKGKPLAPMSCRKIAENLGENYCEGCQFEGRADRCPRSWIITQIEEPPAPPATMAVATDQVGEDIRETKKQVSELKKQAEPENTSLGNDKTITKLLPFPDIISGIAGKFADLYSANLESPKEFFYISFLTCLGSVISDKITLKTEINPQPRLYVLLLGESGDSRKSTAVVKSYEFFKQYVENFRINFGVGSAEGLFKSLGAENTTKKLLLCFDEFKTFVSKCKIDTSVLLQAVTSLFEANRYESHTKKSSIDLSNIHLSILAASTINTYEKCWDLNFTDIGFNNRLFICPGRGEKKFAIPNQIPENKKKAIANELGEILKFYAGEKLIIEFDAKKLYEEWYLSFQGSEHTKRLDTYALRFMILFAVNEKKSVVDIDIVKKVIALMDWELKIRQLYDPVGVDSKVGAMEELIRRYLRLADWTENKLKKITNTDKKGLWFFTTAIKNLLQAREIIKVRGKRKDSIIYKLSKEEYQEE